MEDAVSAILDYQMHAVMAFVKVKIGDNLWKPRFMTHVKSCPNSSKRAHSPNQATKSGKTKAERKLIRSSREKHSYRLFDETTCSLLVVLNMQAWIGLELVDNAVVIVDKLAQHVLPCARVETTMFVYIGR